MTKKYQVRFPAPGKKKQIFTVKAKSRMDAWKIGAGKYTGKLGNKHYINTLYPSFTEIKENEYKGIAHTIRDIMENGFDEPKTIDLVYEPEEELYEHDYIEERRKGPTSGLTRQKQRLGALKARRSRSVGGIKKFPKKRPLEEMVRADQPPDKPVTKYDPVKNMFRVIARNGRRKRIDLKNSNPKVPRKFKGWRPYVNSWTGEQFNN